MGMRRCTCCGAETGPSFAFCQSCGQSLRPPAERTCVGCGAKLDPSFRFCGHCGRPAGEETTTDPRRQPSPARPPAAPAPGGPDAGVAKAALAAAEAPTGLRLVAVRHDGQPGAVVSLGRGAVLCGRARGQFLFADDATVSPEHARFTPRAEGPVVEDLGSLNGTFLRLRGPRALASGDEVRLGRQLLRLDPVPRPPNANGTRPWGSPDAGCRARLVQLLDGGGTGEVFPLRRGENAVGREAGHVVFPGDRYVSARHARIDVNDGGIVLSDLGSANGTFVRITGATPIGPGDQLLIGMQLVRVEA